jgi:hypothetical protein
MLTAIGITCVVRLSAYAERALWSKGTLKELARYYILVIPVRMTKLHIEFPT